MEEEGEEGWRLCAGETEREGEKKGQAQLLSSYESLLHGESSTGILCQFTPSQSIFLADTTNSFSNWVDTRTLNIIVYPNPSHQDTFLSYSLFIILFWSVLFFYFLYSVILGNLSHRNSLNHLNQESISMTTAALKPLSFHSSDMLYAGFSSSNLLFGGFRPAGKNLKSLYLSPVELQFIEKCRMGILQNGARCSLLPSNGCKISSNKFRHQKQKNFSFDPLRISTVSVGLIGEFDSSGNFRGSKRKGTNFARVKSVVEMDKVAESSRVFGGADGSRTYDAIVIGSGIGGLVSATQLAVKGAQVLVLEKYVIPGGSSGFYERDGFKFDVGSSVMFGFSDKGNLNFITQVLAAVGCKMDVIPDPTTVHFHLPNNLSVQVHREYSDFVAELVSKFPHEKEGILKFYGICWKVFNCLNSMELKSLEEPMYLFGQFFKKPIECFTLAYYLPQNAGDIARKFIKDPDLLSFIDAECFIVSTVNALRTPMINASLVLCNRHFGGINYPVGGVGEIAKSLAKGLVKMGGEILYKANVTNILVNNGKAVGVKLSDGRKFYANTIISNATRWDTFGKLLDKENLPQEEENFQKAYVKAPSFLSIHMGIKAETLPPDTDCHHFVLEDDWDNLEKPYGSIFLSIPTVLDPSLAPEGCHILHIFTTSSIEDWEGLSRKDYVLKKELIADKIINRLEKKLFPGLKSAIVFKEVGTPKTHRRYLARDSGTYGPMPRGTPRGLLAMPFNTTSINGLYCVGDSCFPGQGVIAVAFSGIMCAHRVGADLGLEKKVPVLDAALLQLLKWLRTLA